MEYKNFQFNNARKQIKNIVPTMYSIDTDNHNIIDNDYDRKYHYTFVNDNNIANYIIISLDDIEKIDFVMKLNDEGIEIESGHYNGKKCKSDRTLKKFETLATLFYSMYLENMLF